MLKKNMASQNNIHYLPERNEPIKRADDTIHGKGPRGPGDGGGMDNLEKRVTNLEGDVKVIREDLTTLTVRSESFATKADVADIRAEMAEMRGELRTEMAELRGELRSEMSKQYGEINTALSTQSGNLKTELLKAVNKQTVLLLTIIPLAFAFVTFLFDYFKR
jgi:hypothetical protein